MSYPPPPSGGLQPNDDRPSWYTPAPDHSQPSRQAPPNPYTQQDPDHFPAAAPPAHGYGPGYHRRPGDPYGHGAALAPGQRPRSEGLAIFGWILAVVFGLLFILFFLAGVSSFNDNFSADEDAAYNVGVFIGLLIILVIPAIPIFIGIRLIRQPNRQPKQRF